MANYLSIDFGTKRIGVAISAGFLAEPLTIIEGDWANEKNWSSAIDQLANIIKTENITQIIVGISENQMAELTQQFMANFSKVIDLPVAFIDETLSSHQMHQNLTQAKKSKRNQPIDHLVAAALLQEWLDNR